MIGRIIMATTLVNVVLTDIAYVATQPAAVGGDRPQILVLIFIALISLPLAGIAYGGISVCIGLVAGMVSAAGRGSSSAVSASGAFTVLRVLLAGVAGGTLNLGQERFSTLFLPGFVPSDGHASLNPAIAFTVGFVVAAGVSAWCLRRARRIVVSVPPALAWAHPGASPDSSWGEKARRAVLVRVFGVVAVLVSFVLVVERAVRIPSGTPSDRAEMLGYLPAIVINAIALPIFVTACVAAFALQSLPVVTASRSFAGMPRSFATRTAIVVLAACVPIAVGEAVTRGTGLLPGFSPLFFLAGLAVAVIAAAACGLVTWRTLRTYESSRADAG